MPPPETSTGWCGNFHPLKCSGLNNLKKSKLCIFFKVLLFPNSICWNLSIVRLNFLYTYFSFCTVDFAKEQNSNQMIEIFNRKGTFTGSTYWPHRIVWALESCQIHSHFYATIIGKVRLIYIFQFLPWIDKLDRPMSGRCYCCFFVNSKLQSYRCSDCLANRNNSIDLYLILPV